MSTSSHSDQVKDLDLEKGSTQAPQEGDVVSADDGVKRKSGPLAPLWKVAEKLDSYGVEVRGVERVEEHERAEKSYVCLSLRRRRRGERGCARRDSRADSLALLLQDLARARLLVDERQHDDLDVLARHARQLDLVHAAGGRLPHDPLLQYTLRSSLSLPRSRRAPC